jgi:hypothetical protein
VLLAGVPMDVENLEEYVNVEADRQSPADTQDDAQSQNSTNPTHLKRHGYAMIEVHKNAARVIRWEVVDEPCHDPSPEDMLQQKELFQLGEWLATIPISDRDRARYFEIERVSLKPSNRYSFAEI